jgi:nicotinate-nucleotide pyrophosphorylase (carboxylating)
LDIREEMLRNVRAKGVTASIIADDDGIVAGTTSTRQEAEKLGLSLLKISDDGSQVKKGDEIIRFVGSPKQIVLAEEILIGLLAKPSGIATSAHQFVKATGGKPKIVSGAWKKMPPSLKSMIREAVTAGGANYRMAPPPFVYMDKNYVRLLGGIKRSLELLSHLTDIPKVVQVKGTHANVTSEACEAAEYGAKIVFIDTGRPEDIRPVSEALLQRGLRTKVELAFGRGVSIKSIEELKALDVDILDIGRPIVDAPILDMRLEIIGMEN